MLVLFETPAGFALFKVLDEAKLANLEDLWKYFQTSESARKVVKLKAFNKFENTAEALSSTTLLVDSKPSKDLRKFLKKHCDGETLAVADSKLGNAIKEKLKIDCIHNNSVMELLRGVRSQLNELIEGLGSQDLAPMSLGLSHSLSRFKLKFSPDKVDTMIIQAIGLLDDLDKELNTYAMRVREWYGWHFPELTKIVQDNIQYAKAVKLMGSRENASGLDFSETLPEEVEAELKEAAVISMGTEISDIDMLNIKALCDQVIELSEYRGQLFDYLRSRMNAIAPNLTAMVGELVGARLIAHTGSLLNLSKQPASTIQILGAEKALFRALKTKHETPKYGLIFHASLVGQAAPKLKGKISRSLAAKTALAIRCDALGEDQDASVGLEGRMKVEARLRQLETRVLGRLGGSSKGKPKIEAYDKERKKTAAGLLTAAKAYNPAADSTIGHEKPSEKRKTQDAKEEAPGFAIGDENDLPHAEAMMPEKKKKRKKKGEEDNLQEEPTGQEDTEKKKRKKKKKDSFDAAEEDDLNDASDRKEKKKKKSKKESSQEDVLLEVTSEQPDGKAKKRKDRDDEATEIVEEPEKKKKKKKKQSS